MQGKQPYQKLKPYLILNYLMEESDINNPVKVSDIIAYLEEFGISAERRSVYRDIEEINIVLYLKHNFDATIDEAIEMMEDEEERYVVYDENKKGYYLQNRDYEVDDIRLLSECIYATKFIDEKTANRLVDVLISLLSEKEAWKIKKDIMNVDRNKNSSKNIFYNLNTINKAMSLSIDGEKHIPEKISFKYLKYTIQNLKEQVAKHGGEVYVVSPYKLLINDGNYYLRAYSDSHHEMRTYRVDRMTDIKFTGINRDGDKEFAAEKEYIKSFPQRVFSMFTGEKVRVTIQAELKLLDAFIERFGTKGNLFRKIDENHFQIDCNVEISEQFYGWLLGFGTKVKLIYPERTVSDFKKYINDIQSEY